MTRLLALAVAIAALLAVPALAAAAPHDSRVAFWRLNETAGTQIGDSAPEPEQITNTGFETNASGWNPTGLVSLARDTTRAHGGTASLKAVGDSSADRAYWTTAPLIAGRRYTFSAWVYVEPGSTTDKIFIRAVDDAGVGSGVFTGNATDGTTGAWKRLAVTFVATSSTVHLLQLRQNLTGSATWYLDDASFQEHPERITNAGFETNASGWNPTGVVSMARDTARKRSGVASLKAVGDSSADRVYWTTAPLVTGRRYTFSAWVYVEPGATTDKIFIRAVDNSGVGSGVFTGNATDGATGAWKRLSVSFVAVSSTVHLLQLRQNLTGSVTWYVDDASLLENNSGTLTGAFAFAQPGATLDGDSGLMLDGSTAYATVPDTPALDLGDNFSIEAWVKRDRASGIQMIVSKQGSAYALYANGTTLTLARGATEVVTATTPLASDGRWHHVVATKDSSAARLYLDGVDVSGSGTFATFADNSAALMLGANNTTPIQVWDGGLDDVGLYSRALTAAEVAQLYGSAARTQRPVAVTAPAISGTARLGQMLTADRGTWTDSPTAYRYRWLRCDAQGGACTPIAGATSGSYALVAADVGSSVRVEVEADNIAGTGVARSQATAVVEGPKPENVTPPSITGDAVANSVLTAQDGSWSNDPTAFAYQWQRCDASGCSDVAGATARTYLVRAADVGARLRVSVTASNQWGQASALSSETSPVGEPDMAAAYVQAVEADIPQHYFRFEDPNTLDLRNETAGPTGLRAWGTGITPGTIDNGIDLHNASNGFARLPGAVIGVNTTIEFWLKTTSTGNVVTNRNETYGGGLLMVVNGEGELSISETDSHQGSSSCTGSCPVNDGAWHHVAYVQDAAANQTRWYIDGVETNQVTGVLSAPSYSMGWSGTTYLGWDQYGWRGTIPVGIEASLDEFAIYDHPLPAESVAGHFSSRVRPVPPTNRTAAKVAGDAREGDTLTAQEGQWWDRPTAYEYRWQRCGGSGCSDIAGATARDYTPTPADVGSRLRVVVTASNAWGSGTSESAQTIPVLAADNGAAYASSVGANAPAHWYRFEDPSTFDLTDVTGGATGVRASATGIGRGPVDNGIDLHNASNGFARLPGAVIGVNTTIEFWLKTTSTGNVVTNRNETYGGGLLMVVNGEGELSISETDSHQGSSSCTGSCPVNDGAWHHVAYVQDAAANQTRWYIDGVETNQVAGVLSAPSYSMGWSGTTYLGWDQYGWRGTIPVGIEASLDEFAIYGGPLSAATVAAHFDAAH